MLRYFLWRWTWAARKSLPKAKVAQRMHLLILCVRLFILYVLEKNILLYVCFDAFESELNKINFSIYVCWLGVPMNVYDAEHNNTIRTGIGLEVVRGEYIYRYIYNYRYFKDTYQQTQPLNCVGDRRDTQPVRISQSQGYNYLRWFDTSDTLDEMNLYRKPANVLATA